MLAHAVRVPANIDDVAVVEESVDQRRHHNFITEDFAPFFKALERSTAD
jgi:hypothetical protein